MGAVQLNGGWLIGHARDELKILVKEGIDLASHLGGLTAVRQRRAGDGGAVILAYHSVIDATSPPTIDPKYAVTAELFARQVAFLVRHRNVISMAELQEYLDDGRTPPPGTVVITFDDGYLNNLEVAAPILADAGLPATFYLATGYVSDAENQWVDALYLTITRRTRDELTIGGQRFDLSSWVERGRAQHLVCSQLLPADRVERTSVLKEVADQLQPEGPTPRLTMDWGDVRALVEMSDRFELGVHTRDHLDLSALSEDDIRTEIACSMDDLRHAMGREARFFSYPYGRLDASGGRIPRELGLASAVLTEPIGVVGAGSDPHRLPRMSRGVGQWVFKARTTGFAALSDRRSVHT